MKFPYFLLLLTLFSSTCGERDEFIPAEGRSGSITRFAVHQGYMYSLNQNEVQTYSLQNPDQPVLVHRLPTDYGLETIIVYDNTIYIGSRTALYILNISNPAIPVIQSESIREDFFGGCDPVVVKGNYAYSTIKIIENVCGRVNVESALLVYDVTNKSNPQNVYQQTMAMPNGLGYKDNYLFVCDEGTDQITVFDISTPEIPKATTYAVPLIDPVDLIVDDQKMIVSSKTDFFIYDISDIQSIKKIAQIGR